MPKHFKGKTGKDYKKAVKEHLKVLLSKRNKKNKAKKTSY